VVRTPRRLGPGRLDLDHLDDPVLGSLLVAAVYFIRHRRPPTAATGTAETFLAERYARGEIDIDEYRRRQAVLREYPDSSSS